MFDVYLIQMPNNLLVQTPSMAFLVLCPSASLSAGISLRKYET